MSFAISAVSISGFEQVHCVKSVQIRSFFWSVFSCIRTEYGHLLRKSPYSVQAQENTDQKKLRIWTAFTQWFSCVKKRVLLKLVVFTVMKKQVIDHLSFVWMSRNHN